MPARQVGGISHEIMCVAHQALSRCLIYENVVIYADSFLCLELTQERPEYPHPRSASLQVPSRAWYRLVPDCLVTTL